MGELESLKQLSGEQIIVFLQTIGIIFAVIYGLMCVTGCKNKTYAPAKNKSKSNNPQPVQQQVYFDGNRYYVMKPAQQENIARHR